MDDKRPTKNRLLHNMTYAKTQQARDDAKLLLDTGCFREPTREESQVDDHPNVMACRMVAVMTKEEYAAHIAEPIPGLELDLLPGDEFEAQEDVTAGGVICGSVTQAAAKSLPDLKRESPPNPVTPDDRINPHLTNIVLPNQDALAAERRAMQKAQEPKDDVPRKWKVAPPSHDQQFLEPLY
jgi:hypothetical protein